MIFCYFDICKVLDIFDKYVVISLSSDKLHAIHCNLEPLGLPQHEDLISISFIKEDKVTLTPQDKKYVEKFRSLKLFDNSEPRIQEN